MGFSLRPLGRKITDIFDANSESDQQKRLAQGQQRMYADQQRAQGNARPDANVGQAIVRGTVGATAKFANTAVNQAKEIVPTSKGLVASLTNNQVALSNALKEQDQVRKGYNSNSGLLGMGTLYNEDEAKKGEFTTGLKRIGGGTLESGLEVASLGTGSFAGKELATQGLKAGFKSQLPAIAKTAALNTAQGAVSSFNRDEGLNDIVKNAAISGVVGTGADIGLGVLGAGAAKGVQVAGDVLPKVASKVDEVAFTPRTNRLDIETQDALKAYSDRLVGADPEIKGKIESDLITKVREIGDANGVDLTNGTVTQQMDRIESLLNGYKEVSQGGYVKVPKGAKDPAPDLNDAQKAFINDYAEMIQGMGEGNGVSMLPDGTRVSSNYRPGLDDKKLTKAQWFDKARQDIESGKGAYGASEDYKALSAQAGKPKVALKDSFIEAVDGDGNKIQIPKSEWDAEAGLPKELTKPAEPPKPGTDQYAEMVDELPKVKSKGIEADIERVMAEEGIGREAAGIKLEQALKRDLAPGQELFQDGATPRVIGDNAKKDAAVKEVLGKLSNTRTAANTERDLTANIIRSSAQEEGVNLDRAFLDRYQQGAITDPAEKRVAQVIKKETDRIFEQQKQIDPSIKYRQDYIPQDYAQPAVEVEDAVNNLRKTTGSANQRAFRNYQEAGEFGLDPKYDTVDKMVGANAQVAREALGNRDAVEAGLASGLFTANPQKARGLSTIEGFYDNQGNQLYGSKKVADVINGVMQESTTGVQRAVKKSRELNSLWQDVALAGGIPGTPLNFFTFGQAVKDLTSGRVSVVKDLFYSMSDKATARRFAENSDFVREMADRGLRLNANSSLTNEGSNALASFWGKAVNQPTFGRFMPNQYLTVAENTFKKLEKKLGRDEALNIAADTAKKFYGITDEIAKGRDKFTSDAIGSVFFAPKYRESILNTLFNTGRSVVDPRTYGDKSFNMNRRLAAGIAVTAVAYDQLNRQINGHGMMDNRDGQELSLQIPYGEKDEKGNQKVINIPFMPGFMTLPRAAFNAAVAGSKGDGTAVASEAGKTLSMPLKTGTELLTNKDYFSRPIRIDQNVADREGVEADSAAKQLRDTAGYIAGQSSPSWVRAGIGAAKGKPIEEVLATGLEAPVRFGKVINPDTTAYIEVKDTARNALNKNEKAVFDKLYPVGKDIKGEDIKETNPNTKIEKSTLLRANQNVFDKVSTMNKDLKAKTGQEIDPVYELPWDKAQSVLWARSLPPGEGGETKGELLYNQPWYPAFKAGEDKYYKSLETKFGKKDDPYKYPEETAQINQLQEAYYKLEKGTGDRSDFLDANPALLNYWDERTNATNRHRIALGLPPLKDEETEGFSYYSGGKGGYGRGGSNKITSRGSDYKYAVSLSAGGDIASPKVSTKKIKAAGGKKKSSAKPKVSIKKALV